MTRKPTAKSTAAKIANMLYLTRVLPAKEGELPMVCLYIPRGWVVVHNNVAPARTIGTRGFRAWLERPGDELVKCMCEWAPRLGRHYRSQGSSCGDADDAGRAAG